MAQQTIETYPATGNTDHLPNRKPVEIPHREPHSVIHEEKLPQAPLTPRQKIVEAVKRRPAIFALALVAVVALVLGSWLYFSSYEETDDAQVDGHLDPISARISGTVVSVNPSVEDNHFVAAGTVLAEIDPADYQAEVDRARAEYQRLQASASAAQQDITVTSSGSAGRLNLSQAAVHEAQDSIASERAALDAAQARLAQAEAGYSRAEADRQRYERLLAKHEISQSEYDRIATESSTDREAVNAARAELVAAQIRVTQAESRLAERKADVLVAGSAPEQVKSSIAKAAAAVSEADRARAQLTTAELNLSYSKIIAPVSGIIGRKVVEVGQRVQPGQQLLDIIPVDDVWVTANFKETQLKKMRPGQPVTIHLDSYDRDYHGQLDAIGGATGSRFSLLPPENATGNYVKVVQRIPVRILLSPGEDSDHLLRPGMSVEAHVKLH
ncbi:MAG TPA: HlyD family secretion protein [Terriglobales bacterium]|jgi:membrane fusion protein (multidrug efflux system)|nr:HlyD family secretion protein [Terriglobales bacterium]